MPRKYVAVRGTTEATPSQLELVRRLGRSVFALDTWNVEGLEKVETPDEAVRRAIGD